MRNLNKKELKELYLEVKDTGFVVWDKNKLWVLDGSCFFDEGKVTFSNQNHKDIHVVIEDDDEFYGFKNITLKTNAKRKIRTNKI